MTTKLRLVFTTTIVFLSFYASAQSTYWQQEASGNQLSQNFSKRFDVKKGQHFSFNERLFKKELSGVSVAKKNTRIVRFPNEKGDLVAFQIFETPVLSPELSKKYPNIKSYSGYAVGDKKVKIRFSVSHKGVQSMMVQAKSQSTTFIQKDSGNNYVLYTRGFNEKEDTDFVCSTKSAIENSSSGYAQKVVDDQTLRKYRLAVSASGEYTQYHGGTVADALAAINATVTRINEVFETDLSVTLELVTEIDQVIYTDPLTDPYTDNLSPQTQSTLNSVIGAANYDIGILFNQADQSDGNAGFIGTVCVDNRKGSAYATGEVPEGDIYDIDFVSHEMGHQFGANHTWSFESEGTQVQVEPGSGSTIMGYAGITGINNVATMGEDYFHYVSIVQMTDYLKTTSCAQTTSLANVPPVITPIDDFIIPISTAFVLTGTATDVDIADVLTFTWEQVDDGVVPQSVFGPTNPIGANFRSQKPSLDPQRYFPKLSSVVQGNLTQTLPPVSSGWETVSDVERAFNFAFTVRDNAIGGGQVVSDLVHVFVENNAGPFEVTSQSTTVVTTAGDIETISWNVANTNIAPVNTQLVDILLSIDGGQTFPITLAENVSNDGSHDIVIPGNETTEARIMIKAVGNIFFALNTSDFEIESSEIVLNITELEQDVCQGDVLVVPFMYETYQGFNEEATFSVALPPVGVGIAFSPTTATVTNTPVALTITNTENLTVGSYPIRLVATTASLAKEVTFNLNVYDTGFVATTLLAPADGLLDTPTGILLEWEPDFLASSYTIEVATDLVFSNVVETFSGFSTSYTPVNLNNQTQYFWRVKPGNDCGEGVFGTPFSFTTIQFNCENRVGGGLPLSISTSGTPTVVSEITIFDDLPVADIDVNLVVDHTYLSDLTITLTSPAGTSVVLMSNSCEEFVNIDATFDDDAADLVCNGDPAVSGMVKPRGTLSSFNGESTFGTWVLTVADNAPADGGSFRSFSLDVCAEGVFRPDADGDGVFDDGPDLCLGTPEGTEVDSSGCPVLVFPKTNFTVEIQSESCRNNNDGSIIVGVKVPVNYAITITGNDTNISDTFVAPEYALNNLMSGTYSICITAEDGGLNYREQCFEVDITEPELLSVSSKTSLDGSFVELQLQGASLYNIELNGVVIQTEESQITLNLKDGSNSLKVTTNIPCQGAIEEQFFYTTDPIVYPNPFTDFVKVFLGARVEEIEVRIFTVNGTFIRNEKLRVNGSELELDLSALSAGLYIIQFDGETIKGTTKVIKK